MTVCAGVSLFLFAMLLLEQSFKLLSSGVLDVFLNSVADRKWKSFFFGFLLSTLVQSSGLVTVIAVSFLSAGLISLASGIAIIYGVNLSAACTTWIVGYFGLKAKISLYAMPFIIFGVTFYLSKNTQIRGGGLFLLSLGLLFLGISWMKDGFDTFKSTIDFSEYMMPGLTGVLLCTLVGLLITAITQSSHATLTLAITALTVNQIDYLTAVGISIGAAVGSTIFTIIGSLNANIEGKKIAVTHVFFKLLCAVFAIAFLNQYLILTDYLAVKIGISVDDHVYKLAIFMSLFNIFGVIVLTPFIEQMCRVLNRWLISRNTESIVDSPRFLNEISIEYAESAIETLEAETKHLFSNTLEIMSSMVGIPSDEIKNNTMSPQELVDKYNTPLAIDYDDVYRKRFKVLYSDIIDYGVRATNAEGMNTERLSKLMEIRRACIIMAAAIKKAQQLNVNILRYSSSSNDAIKGEYNHIRRNMIRLIRLLKRLETASYVDQVNILECLTSHKNKFDAISSSALDTLIRNREISHTEATSIMNDNALSRSICKNLNHVAKIMTTYDFVVD